MSTQQFLDFCIKGDINSIKQLKASRDPRNFIYTPILKAITLYILLFSMVTEVSQSIYFVISIFLLTSSQRTVKSIFHSMARGLRARQATHQNFAELRKLNLKNWQEEKERGLQKIEERKAAHPDLKASENLVVKIVENEEENLFGNQNLTVTKYILRKYHVGLKHNNSMGHSPADLAESLQVQDLAEFYRLELTSHMIGEDLL